MALHSPLRTWSGKSPVPSLLNAPFSCDCLKTKPVGQPLVSRYCELRQKKGIVLISGSGSLAVDQWHSHICCCSSDPAVRPFLLSPPLLQSFTSAVAEGPLFQPWTPSRPQMDTLCYSSSRAHSIHGIHDMWGPVPGPLYASKHPGAPPPSLLSGSRGPCWTEPDPWLHILCRSRHRMNTSPA